jgi:hypothetical protein
MEWLAALLIPVLAGFVAGRIARDKGRSPTLWRWLTFLCCPLLIVLMLLPAKGASASGAGMLAETIGIAAVVLVLLAAGLYQFSGASNGKGGGRADQPPSADCARLSDDSNELAAALMQAIGDPNVQLAMSQNDGAALCRSLDDLLPKIRQVRAEAGSCKTDDNAFSGVAGLLLDRVAAACP